MARAVQCRSDMTSNTARWPQRAVAAPSDHATVASLGTTRHRRGRRRGQLLTWGAVLGSLPSLWAEPAAACSGWYAYSVPGAHATVPANGGAMVYYKCQRGTSGCAWRDPIAVFRDGEEVPGTFTHHGEDYTFVPDEPLEVGVVYTVPEFGEVTAVEAVPVDLTLLTTNASLVPGRTLGAYEQVCCEEAIDSCSVYPCWRTSDVEVTMSLALSVGAGGDAIERPRTELRFSWTTSDGDSGQTEWAPGSVEQSLDVASESYCVIPELRSLLTGETLMFDEVCLEHGGLPRPGDIEVLPADTDILHHAACPVPLEGYEAQWCTETRLLCQEDEFYCDRMVEHCPDAAGFCEVQGVGRAGAGVGNWAVCGILLAAIGCRRRARG